MELIKDEVGGKKTVELIVTVFLLPLMSVGFLIFSSFAFFVIGDVVILQLALFFSFMYMSGEVFIVYLFEDEILELKNKLKDC